MHLAAGSKLYLGLIGKELVGVINPDGDRNHYLFVLGLNIVGCSSSIAAKKSITAPSCLIWTAPSCLILGAGDDSLLPLANDTLVGDDGFTSAES